MMLVQNVLGEILSATFLLVKPLFKDSQRKWWMEINSSLSLSLDLAAATNSPAARCRCRRASTWWQTGESPTGMRRPCSTTSTFRGNLMMFLRSYDQSTSFTQQIIVELLSCWNVNLTVLLTKQRISLKMAAWQRERRRKTVANQSEILCSM